MEPLDDEDRRPHPFRLVMVIAGIVVLLLAAFALTKCLGDKKGAPPPRQMPVMVNIAPPPPRSTPPPRATPPPEPRDQPEPKPDEMIDQPPVQEDQPPAPAEAPPEEPPAGLGTNITGDGPGDSFGLSGSGNGRIGGTGTGSGGGGGGKWGAYAAQVQSQVASALRGDSETRLADLRITVKVWPDSSGRITRAQLVGSSGDPAMDRAIERVLTSTRLSEPPPADMPSPINLRITARRPSQA